MLIADADAASSAYGAVLAPHGGEADRALLPCGGPLKRMACIYCSKVVIFV